MLDQIRLWQQANRSFCQFAVLEKQQHGDSLDLKFLRQLWRFVHVDFDELDFARVLIRQTVHCRCELAAWAAPGRVKIHDDRQRGLRHLGIKILVRNVLHIRGGLVHFG